MARIGQEFEEAPSRDMPKPRSRTDGESVNEVLVGGVWAGLGGAATGALLVGCTYLFAKESRPVIEAHVQLVLLGLAVLFLLGFGVSVQSVLEMQWLRGKWK